jgi:RNA polymerase sigma-70 factor (family 1)
MRPLEQLDDLDLLALLKEGNHFAFNQIYSKYWEVLYRAAYNILRDTDACDDIVQELFVWLWSNRERHTTDSLKPYLYAAVKYKVANLIRHGKVKDAFFSRTVANYQEAIAPEDSYDVNHLKSIIAAFTETLPDRAREVFKLSREQLLTNKEIAARLDITEKTVENQMNISLKKLKLTLGKMSFWSTFL